MVCGNFILPEPASYVFFYAFSNLRNLLYIIHLGRKSKKMINPHEFRLYWISFRVAKETVEPPGSQSYNANTS